MRHIGDICIVGETKIFCAQGMREGGTYGHQPLYYHSATSSHVAHHRYPDTQGDQYCRYPNLSSLLYPSTPNIPYPSWGRPNYLPRVGDSSRWPYRKVDMEPRIQGEGTLAPLLWKQLYPAHEQNGHRDNGRWGTSCQW